MTFSIFVIHLMNIMFVVLAYFTIRGWLQFRRLKMGLVESTLNKVKSKTEGINFFQKEELLHKAITLDMYIKNISRVKLLGLSIASTFYIFTYISSLLIPGLDGMYFMLFLAVVIILVMVIIYDMAMEIVINRRTLELYDDDIFRK